MNCELGLVSAKISTPKKIRDGKDKGVFDERNFHDL